MLVSWRRWVLLITLVVLQVIGFLFFVKGFFPSKIVLPGVGLNNFHQDQAQFDKLIFMVVDAMRSDFMFSENSQMTFVHSLIRDGKALGFTAFSNPPTVTLPRLKGITTGSTPNFLDAILNIAEDDTSSTLGDQDSWIRQLHLSGKSIHMYGDDTWIKLFPNFFNKYEGTSSFYVSDFTEVDNNVTRHINDELLLHQDWDCLILHYLGLDHIGHKGGPDSSNMPVKQLEMDDIIKEIYQYVEAHQDTLFVVLGDHGMNEVGNHGGSSIGETSAAMLTISSKFKKPTQLPLPVNDEFTYYNRIQQIDLVPTLAALLNFAIPKNNLGIFIDDFKNLYNDKSYKDILMANAYQLKELVEHSFGKKFEETITNTTSFDQFSQLWFKLQITRDELDIKNFMTMSQSKLAESATNYNYQEIFKGVSLFAICSIGIISTFCHIGISTQNKIMSTCFLIFAILLSISNFGSSLIEEEYQIWWWFITIFVTILISYLKPPNLILNFTSIFCLLRLIRGWNNSGQKFNIQSNLKIGKFLDSNDYNVNLIVIFYFLFLFYIFKKSGFFSLFKEYQILIFLPIFTLFSFSLMAKLIACFIEDEVVNVTKFNGFILSVISWPKEILQVDDLKKCLNPIFIVFYYIFFALLILRFVISFWDPKIHQTTFFSDFTNIFTVFLLNQTAPKNVLIYAVFLTIRYLIGRMTLKSLYTNKTQNIFAISLIFTSFNLLIQHFSFFSLGNTNSLSTVDLTNAFNGLSDYDLIFCGLLTFSANWAAPIFWSLSYLILVLENAQFLKKYKYDLLYFKLLILMTFYSIIGIGLLAACISLRFHLFIWTVFSPKILYFASWYIFMNLGVDLILSYVLIAFY